MADLSPRWIVIKAILFGIMLVTAAALLIWHQDPWVEAGLLLVCLWAACRLYYFLFHVLQHWLGGGRYTGLLDLLRRRLRR